MALVYAATPHVEYRAGGRDVTCRVTVDEHKIGSQAWSDSAAVVQAEAPPPMKSASRRLP
jgi:hypothetical protein